MWLEILGGLASMIIYPLVGIGFYRLAGIAFGITFSILVVREIVYLILAYYGFSGALTSKPFKKLINWIALIVLGQKIKLKLDEVVGDYKQRRNNKKHESISNKKIVNWILDHNRTALILSFIPFVPWLPTSSIIAVRLTKIKYGLFLLCLSTLFRAFVCCLLIYTIDIASLLGLIVSMSIFDIFVMAWF